MSVKTSDAMQIEQNKRDKYCWICHSHDESSDVLSCISCVRVYHAKCLTTGQNDDQHTEEMGEPNDNIAEENSWTCFECQRLKLENLAQTTLKQVTEDQFYAMLSFAVKRLKYNASEPFQKEVDLAAFPHYNDFIVNPMDISLMEKKIDTKKYVSLEALCQDCKWIVHNCTIFNGAQNKLTAIAKTLFKMIKHELSEIEVCPDCYVSSISKNNEHWFTEPCRTPHPLVFAKIKGFPYWPAKALKSIGTTEIDVRFFGAHDRSIVPVDKCYWLSKELPANVRNHVMINMQPSVIELNAHIKKLEQTFGSFQYAPVLMPVDLHEPFVFIEAFKDINCLPSMSENSRVTRKRTTSLPIIPTQTANSVVSANTSQVKPSGKLTITKTVSTVTSASNDLTRRRSNRSIANKKEDPETSEMDDNSSILLPEDDPNHSQIENLTINHDEESTFVSVDSSTTVGIELNTSIRSKRLRKLSNKYSGYSVETIPTISATKRKSTMSTRGNQLSSISTDQTTPHNSSSSIKKLRSDSDSNSKSSMSLIFTPSTIATVPVISSSVPTGNKSVTKTASISSTRSSYSESEVGSSQPLRLDEHHHHDEEVIDEEDGNESTNSSIYSTEQPDQRHKRKEQNRLEKKVLRAKNKQQHQNMETDVIPLSSSSTLTNTNPTATSSITSKRFGFNTSSNNLNGNGVEDNSSILVSTSSSTVVSGSAAGTNGLSPIKIKISRNLDDKTKSSSFLIDSSNSPSTPQPEQSSQNNASKSIKLNLGELLFKCKKSLGLLSPPSFANNNDKNIDNNDRKSDSSIKSDESLIVSNNESLSEKFQENKILNKSSVEKDDNKSIEIIEISNDLMNQEKTQTTEALSDTNRYLAKLETKEKAKLTLPETNSYNDVVVSGNKLLLNSTSNSEQINNQNTLNKTNSQLNNVDNTIRSNPIQVKQNFKSTTNDLTNVNTTTINPSILVHSNIQDDQDSGLEPGEIVRVSQQQSSQQKNLYISNALQEADQSKMRKVISPFSNESDEILLPIKSSVNIASKTATNDLILTSNTNSTKSKREQDLEKIIEEKAFKTKEMKQFYEKLIRELKSSHEQQQNQLIKEIKYNCDLKISEIIKESTRKEMKLKADYERRVTETKSKQWCACCGKEAIYYCCWNTSYCDEECQKMHWGHHLKTCTRIASVDVYSNNINGEQVNNDSIINHHHNQHNNNKYNDYTEYSSLVSASATNFNINTNNTNDTNNYETILKLNQQRQQQKPVHVQHMQQQQNFQQYTGNNGIQTKKIPIQITNHTGFASNNNNSNNNANRKVTL